MARALIVGCGCRGQALGRSLIDQGWSVRGTTRTAARVGEIEAAGIEAAIADPDRPGTILELVGDVTVVLWLMATAQDEPEVIAAIHGPRLERLLEKLVDTPVRGFVYEGEGAVQAHRLAAGRELVEAAADRWRIPCRVIEADPAGHEEWLAQARQATLEVVSR